MKEVFFGQGWGAVGKWEAIWRIVALKKNPGYAPGFVDYHEINEELLF